MEQIYEYLGVESTRDAYWVLIGVLAQLSFSARFIVQWLASERAGESVVPVAFWWFSLFGGLVLLAYGFYRGEIVIILGQSTGVIIYLRNLWLIYRKRS